MLVSESPVPPHTIQDQNQIDSHGKETLGFDQEVPDTHLLSDLKRLTCAAGSNEIIEALCSICAEGSRMALMASSLEERLQVLEARPWHKSSGLDVLEQALAAEQEARELWQKTVQSRLDSVSDVAESRISRLADDVQGLQARLCQEMSTLREEAEGTALGRLDEVLHRLESSIERVDSRCSNEVSRLEAESRQRCESLERSLQEMEARLHADKPRCGQGQLQSSPSSRGEEALWLKTLASIETQMRKEIADIMETSAREMSQMSADHLAMCDEVRVTCTDEVALIKDMFADICRQVEGHSLQSQDVSQALSAHVEVLKSTFKDEVERTASDIHVDVSVFRDEIKQDHRSVLDEMRCVSQTLERRYNELHCSLVQHRDDFLKAMVSRDGEQDDSLHALKLEFRTETADIRNGLDALDVRLQEEIGKVSDKHCQRQDSLQKLFDEHRCSSASFEKLNRELREEINRIEGFLTASRPCKDDRSFGRTSCGPRIMDAQANSGFQPSHDLAPNNEDRGRPPLGAPEPSRVPSLVARFSSADRHLKPRGPEGSGQTRAASGPRLARVSVSTVPR